MTFGTFFCGVMLAIVEQHQPSGHFFDRAPPLIVSNASNNPQATSYIEALRSRNNEDKVSQEITLPSFGGSSYQHWLLVVDQNEGPSQLRHCFIFSHTCNHQSYNTLVDLMDP